MSLKIAKNIISLLKDGWTAGSPAIFIILQDCPLSCPRVPDHCELKFDKNPSYVIETKEDIVSLVGNLTSSLSGRLLLKHVTISGGEPLSRDNFPLIQMLTSYLYFEKNMNVDFETTMLFEQGDLKNSTLAQNVYKIVESLNSFDSGKHNTEFLFYSGNFNIYPCLDVTHYPAGTDMEDVFRFYCDMSEEDINTVIEWCKFRLVCYPEIEENVLRFVELWEKNTNPDILRDDIIRIVSATTSSENCPHWVSAQSTYESDFCKKHSLIYIPQVDACRRAKNILSNELIAR